MKSPQSRQPSQPEQQAKSDEFTRFEQVLRNLMAVPKSEVDEQRAKYDRQREKESKRKRPVK